MKLPKLDSTLFEWNLWRAGSIHDLIEGPCRTWNIILQREIIKSHAVGWCPAENLPHKPKINEIAVMVFKNGYHFWFHLRKHEFEEIFDNE